MSPADLQVRSPRGWDELFSFTMKAKAKAVLFRDVAPVQCHSDLWISKSWGTVSCHKFFKAARKRFYGGLDWFADRLDWCVSKRWRHGKGIPYCPGFSRHAKNTALIDPPSLSLSLIPSLLPPRLPPSTPSCHLLFSHLSAVSLN